MLVAAVALLILFPSAGKSIYNFLFLLNWICFCFVSGLSLKQSPDLFVKSGENVTLTCSQINTTFNGMYWFRQRPSEPIEMIAYYYINMKTEIDPFKNKVSAVRNKSSLDVTVKEVESADSAVYYSVFGPGTRLTVLGKNFFITLLNHSSEEECTEKRVTLVCLAEDFYPDHIDLAWYIDDKEESTGVAKDDSAKLNTDSNTYSISSRLSIPFKKWNQGNTYKCKVTFHYPKEKSNDGKWTTESSTRWESLTAPKRKSLHFFTFHRW
uniref:Ig-like domain-containing protein n=1 Tax=Astyanax mexicanus TaxID=7994 RepID=A0A8B9LBL7_ASTMX